jgi:RNA polymerase sigma-70 factor (ECF subfamily)
MMRYQQADPTAVAVLIDLLSAPLYHFFASQVGNTTDAEDMLQDAWLGIHRVRHTYRPGEPVLPWIFGVAQRVRVESCRKRRRTASAKSFPKADGNATVAHVTH